MTEPSTQPVTEPPAAPAVESSIPDSTPPSRASLLRVVKDQRKTLLVALALAVASFWIVGQLGEWRLATCMTIGIGLGLLNHLATEFWLLRIVSGHRQPSRSEMIRATMVRLVVLSVVAITLTVMLWPDGVGVLIGLAIFRLIALMMTSVTLLRDLKEELKEP